MLSNKIFTNRVVFRIGLLLLFFSYFSSLITCTERVVLLTQLLIALIFFFSLYCDIKYRKISNERFKDLFLFSLGLNSVDVISSQDVLMFVIIKIVCFLLLFLISMALFSLTIIGGSDGKLIILIFSIHPIALLSFSFLMEFFLLLAILFFGVFVINYIINAIGTSKHSFEILFDFYLNDTIFKRVFIKGFYRFLNNIELGKGKAGKYQFIYFYLIYNNKINAFQILTHYRAPLVVICIISYYITYFLKIGI